MFHVAEVEDFTINEFPWLKQVPSNRGRKEIAANKILDCSGSFENW
jgi:hypothetical protein